MVFESCDVRVYMQVMDVNDCSPRFSAASYQAVVAENSEIGTTITILTATDEDEGNNGQVRAFIHTQVIFTN